mgnify:CR=1 FL=1
MPGYTMKRGAAPKFKDLGSSPGKLKGDQHKIDMNKDGQISKADFDMMNNSPADMHSPAKNYKNPQDYKVFMMGNEATPVKKYKSDAQRKAVHASKAESGAKYASPVKNEGEKKKEKEKRNEFGETREEYIKRMEEMGLRKPDKKKKEEKK